jgi:hypothetical protein
MISNFSHMVSGQPPETNALAHMPIIEAIEQRDPAKAEVIAFDHVKVSVDKIQESFGIWLTPQQRPWFEHPHHTEAPPKKSI